MTLQTFTSRLWPEIRSCCRDQGGAVAPVVLLLLIFFMGAFAGFGQFGRTLSPADNSQDKSPFGTATPQNAPADETGTRAEGAAIGPQAANRPQAASSDKQENRPQGLMCPLFAAMFYGAGSNEEISKLCHVPSSSEDGPSSQQVANQSAAAPGFSPFGDTGTGEEYANATPLAGQTGELQAQGTADPFTTEPDIAPPSPPPFGSAGTGDEYANATPPVDETGALQTPDTLQPGTTEPTTVPPSPPPFGSAGTGDEYANATPPVDEAGALQTPDTLPPGTTEPATVTPSPPPFGSAGTDGENTDATPPVDEAEALQTPDTLPPGTTEPATVPPSPPPFDSTGTDGENTDATPPVDEAEALQTPDTLQPGTTEPATVPPSPPPVDSTGTDGENTDATPPVDEAGALQTPDTLQPGTTEPATVPPSPPPFDSTGTDGENTDATPPAGERLPAPVAPDISVVASAGNSDAGPSSLLPASSQQISAPASPLASALPAAVSRTGLQPGNYTNRRVTLNGTSVQCPNVRIVVEKEIFGIYQGAHRKKAFVSSHGAIETNSGLLTISADEVSRRDKALNLTEFYGACAFAKYGYQNGSQASCLIGHIARNSGFWEADMQQGLCNKYGLVRDSECRQMAACTQNPPATIARRSTEIRSALPVIPLDTGLSEDRLLTKSGQFPANGTYMDGRMTIDGVSMSCPGQTFYVDDLSAHPGPVLKRLANTSAGSVYGKSRPPGSILNSGVLKDRTLLTKLFEYNETCSRARNSSFSFNEHMCWNVKRGKEQGWLGDEALAPLCRFYAGPLCQQMQNCYDGLKPFTSVSGPASYGPEPVIPEGSLAGRMTGDFPAIGVYEGDTIRIDGKSMTCPGTKGFEVLASLPGMDAGARLGTMSFNRSTMKAKSTLEKLMIFTHECAHISLKAGELDADCASYDTGRREGWMTPRDLDYMCQKYKHTGAVGYIERHLFKDLEGGCEFQRACYNGTRKPRKNSLFNTE